MRILIIDDQRSARLVLREMLSQLDEIEIFEASTLTEGQQILDRETIDVALVDIRLSTDPRNRDGLTLISQLHSRWPHTVAVVVTASSEMAEIRAAMRGGAYDYIIKDDLCEELVVPIVQGLGSRRRLEREVSALRARASLGEFPSGLVGSSRAIERVRACIRKVALSDRPVLVTGPTGAGKELIVQAIHALGEHPDEPLLDVNCGGMPEQLIESLLFGHSKGAFTGADRARTGYFGAVRKGTLFLDEVAEMPVLQQSKLLRVLESRAYLPIGATERAEFHGRVVAATHANLAERVREGRFREDLYYRLNVLEVQAPTLDDRKEDIPALVAHFARQQRRPVRFSTEAIGLLERASWPGNVRQLRNVVDRLAVFAEEEEIQGNEVLGWIGDRTAIEAASPSLRTIARAVLNLPFEGNRLAAVEDELVMEAMLRGGTKVRAAELLGVHRKVIERRLGRGGLGPSVGGDDD